MPQKYRSDELCGDLMRDFKWDGPEPRPPAPQDSEYKADYAKVIVAAIIRVETAANT